MYILSAPIIASNVTGSTASPSLPEQASSVMHHIWLWTAAHAHRVCSWLPTQIHNLLDWLKQPHILAVIMAWWITFTVLIILLSSLGFGPTGIVSGSAAAAFQGLCYGGLTPAGGIFATMTSVAMLGWMNLLMTLVAMVGATMVAGVVWLCGAGR